MIVGFQRYSVNLHWCGGGGGGGGDDVPPRPPRRPDDNGDPCDIEIEVVLQSINLELLRPLRLGQSLKIEIVTENKKERLCATLDGKVAGAIVSPIATKIVECIRKGNRYEATITEISGNIYRVRVKRV